MYQERYPLQAAEARAQELWAGQVWPLPDAPGITQAVRADIRARYQGMDLVAGQPSLLRLGVLISSHAPLPDNLFQGADAFRLSCVLSEKTNACPPASCWRLVHQLVHKLRGAEPFSDGVITMYIQQNPGDAAIVKALQNGNFYQALSLVRAGLSKPVSVAQKSFYLAVVYPMVPHAALYLLPNAQQQAAAFYRWVAVQALPLPVLVGGRFCAWYWEGAKASQAQLEKEVLSLPAVSNKIKGKSVQRIIYKKGRVVHVVV
ncbi:MAG: hypothetical protein ILP11_02235 [Alphaproteobacteria bacterium]|nr:hypothetical protein [Alphaproteobacteria bacterium]